ncbi:hypothetical protein N234_31640 [Ralstonia pickettii DTP0602]|nr:hypothetical protein N234_31640 [Ralstonia pickettii DTP0602]
MIGKDTYPNRVTIQRRATGQDEIGQPVETWADVSTVWANIRHTSGMEAIKAGADVSIVRASIRIRWRTGIDAGMRVVHGATVYDIKAVLADEVGRKHVDLVCEVAR